MELDNSARQGGCGLVFQFPERHFLGNTIGVELFVTAVPGKDANSQMAQAAYAARLPSVLRVHPCIFFLMS